MSRRFHSRQSNSLYKWMLSLFLFFLFFFFFFHLLLPLLLQYKLPFECNFFIFVRFSLIMRDALHLTEFYETLCTRASWKGEMHVNLSTLAFAHTKLFLLVLYRTLQIWCISTLCLPLSPCSPCTCNREICCFLPASFFFFFPLLL